MLWVDRSGYCQNAFDRLIQTPNTKLQIPMTAIAAPQPPQVSFKTWIGLFGVMLGAFMAILDIQITNSALKDIQGALSASIEEGSWVATAYLVAEIVVIPLSGWLARVFSIRTYILVNATLFLCFSLCCAWAWDLGSMIVFRGLQGFAGGVLIPMAFTIVLTTLPPAKMPLGNALFGFTAVFAPSIGPTIGGWLTENFGWQYIFYLNIIPGALLIAAVWYAIPPQPMQLNLLKGGDWWGIGCMAIGLASLEVVLEEGTRKDWFGSPLITQLAISAVIFLTLFFWIEFTHPRPFINLRLLKRRNFGLCTIINVALGLGLYGSVYILPLYLAQIQGYNALQIGEVIAWSGIPQLFIIPFIPKLMVRIDVRLLIATGVSLFALSCFMNSGLTADVGMDQLRLPQIVRAIGQPMIMIPLTGTATANIERAQAGSASSLFNMMRNLGGSIGIATLGTVLSIREQFHSSHVGESVSLYDPATQERMQGLQELFIQRGIDPGTAHDRAMAAIDLAIRKQAFVLAYGDCFYFMACSLLVGGMAVLFLQKVKLGGAGSGGH
jgi:MFS transporter, DHA2 family, multidrug resistance protein